MTTVSIEEFYGGENEVRASVPTGTYDVLVEDARGIPKKDESKSGIGNLFLDLQILNGPSAGAVIGVIINVPEPGGKSFHYKKKMSAFTGPDLIAAFAALGAAPTREGILDTLAAASKGKAVSAELNLVTEGAYAGTNELVQTTALTAAPVVTIATAAAAPAAAPAPAPVVAPQPVAVAAAPVAADNGAGAVDTSVPF